MKIDVGCGLEGPIDGYIGCDTHDECGEIKFHCHPWELDGVLQRNSVEAIHASHLLERLDFLEMQSTLIAFYNILKPGGELELSFFDLEQLKEVPREKWPEVPYGYRAGHTHALVVSFLEQAGFSDEDASHFGADEPYCIGVKTCKR